MASRVDVKPPLVTQVAEVVVVDVPLVVCIQVLEAHQLVLHTHLHLQRFHALRELVERDSVVEVHVEEPESWTELLESLFDANPHELKRPTQIYVLLGGLRLLRGCLALEVRRHDVVHLLGEPAVNLFIRLRQVHIQVY